MINSIGSGYILFSNESDSICQTDIDHRAIGVVYNPSKEKYSNYVPSVLSRHYDALIYFDETKDAHYYFMLLH